ncbi:hypothetical protein ACFFOU_21875 [Pseudonocardia sulfidoxydans]|nr:hypothetical protein [Pseudonocardia sulfidoxydans]
MRTNTDASAASSGAMGGGSGSYWLAGGGAVGERLPMSRWENGCGG